MRTTVGEAEFSSCLRNLPPALRSAYESAEGGSAAGGSDSSDPSTLEFGFVPARLTAALREVGNWQVRAQAIVELQQLLAGLSEEHVPRVASHLAPFTDLLTTFLEDTNFKIALTSLQMISDLLDRFGEHIRNGPDSERIFLAIVPRLMDKFADNKIVIRQANFRLTKKLFAIVPPERALPSLLGYAQHANSHIREQAISVLIQTLLTAPRQSLDVYANAMMALAQPLSDSKPKVRQVALEATAVIFETAGASAFESLLRDADLDEEIEHRITERIRQGKSALPTVSSDGLVEFTTQPGLAPRDGGGSGGGAAPPRVPSAGLSGPLAARPPSAGRDRSGTAGGGGGGGYGGEVGGGVSPPTPDEPMPAAPPLSRMASGGSSSAASSASTMLAGVGAAAPAQPDFSDLMEFTAGGRKIATSKGRLPWDMPGPGGGAREGVASRGKAGRSTAPPLLEVTHEGHEMLPSTKSSLSAREPRAGGMRIEVPPLGTGGNGPLSAPSVSIHGKQPTGGPTRDNEIRANGANGSSHGGRGSGTAGGRPVSVNWEDEVGGGAYSGTDAYHEGGMSGTASPHREMELGDAQKIQLWLPERVEGGPAPAPDMVRPMPSRRTPACAGGMGAAGSAFSVPGGGGGPGSGNGPMVSIGAGALSGSYDGSSAGPRDSLKLLKRRQQHPLSASDGGGGSCVGGGDYAGGAGGPGAGGPMLACAACAAQNRAVSAAGRAPQVRLPFEERQRSSSAPHKRTDGGSQVAPETRMEEGVNALTANKASGGSGGELGNGHADSNAALRMGAASLGECGGAISSDAAPSHTGAYPSRGPMGAGRLRGRGGASGAFAGGASGGGGGGYGGGPIAEAPSAAAIRRGPRSSQDHLHLSLDGVGVGSRGGGSSLAEPHLDDGSGGQQPGGGGNAVSFSGANFPAGNRRKGADAPVGGSSSRGGSVGSSQDYSALQEVTQGGGLKVLEELRTEELRGLPMLPAESTMKQVLEMLRSDDWSAHFDSINLLRRVVAWADETGSDGGLLGQLHSINLLLIQYADSLRSALAKNACICFRELFAYLGSKMEADLDLIVPVLIKKAGESNGFICDEANKALSAMVHSVSEGRSIAALIASAAHRNPAARAKAASHLAKALELMGYGRLLHSRELERVMPVLPTLLGEGLSETRAAAKNIVFGLTREARQQPAENERLERLLRRNLSEPAFRKLRESMDLACADAGSMVAGGLRMGPTVGRRGGAGGGAGGGGGGGAAEGRRSGVGATPDAAAAAPGSGRGGQQSGSGDLAQLDEIYKKLGSSDWAARKEGVMTLADLSIREGDAIVRTGKLLTVFDHLTPRLTDSNSKVNCAALQSLQQMVPPLRDGLPSVASTLVPALATSLASSNAQVRAITPGVLDALVNELDHASLIQPFANCVLYSPPKARPAMIDKLRELSTSLYPSKPALVVKHALPTAFRLLEDNRADLRTGTVQLLRMLHVLLGPSLFEHSQRAPSAVQNRLADVIQTI